MGIDLTSSVQYLKGVGPARARLLSRLGINTVEDLLYFFPRRYEDYSNVKRICELQDGESATVVGQIVSSLMVDSKRNRRLSLVTVRITDLTGMLEAKWFYNTPNKQWVESFARRFEQGRRIQVSGTVKREGLGVSMPRPTWEYVDSEPQGGVISPIYPLTEGMNQAVVRRLIESLFAAGVDELLSDPIDRSILERHGLPSKVDALREVHFPTAMANVKRAFTRVAFEEFLLLQLGLALRRVRGRSVKGISHSPDGDLISRLLESIPFKLTGAQLRVIDEIRRDMESPHPMNRLLQGDVGSGKTIVAAYALVKAVESGYQCALMAPTEVLAHQHYESLGPLFRSVGIEIQELRGGTSRHEKDAILEGLRSGDIRVVVGTHALIQDQVSFARLGLVITDEQHRFGVAQRAFLKGKGESPDVLVMTATPIPRTLAMTLYGDLDVSTIDELPPGRQPVVTRWVHGRDRRRVYEFLRKEVAKGRQAYVVCPLVEESEALELRSVSQHIEELSSTYLSGLRIQALHGKMTSQQKEEIIDAFLRGEHDVLVSTTVIEVGVNVPNATLMVIENAERFGLSQLHQLRGRVGRGTHQSYCVMISDASAKETAARLQVMTRTTDGFEIAEEDLKLRGPGEIFGTRQHGLPDTRIANILQHLGVMATAKEEAARICEEDPRLSSDRYKGLSHELNRRFSDWFDLSDVG